MNLRLPLLLIILLIGCAEAESEEIQNQQQPNIVYILADDLGYGELGVYGQEKIETPNLDALAQRGMMFTQHYSGSPVCAPSRYMLMTGKHPGNAYIRGNSELDERGDIWDFEAMYENPELEGQRPIPPSTVTVAEVKPSGLSKRTRTIPFSSTTRLPFLTCRSRPLSDGWTTTSISSEMKRSLINAD